MAQQYPSGGGFPALLLAGAGRHSFGSLTGGSHYRCRFGLDAAAGVDSGSALDDRLGAPQLITLFFVCLIFSFPCFCS